MPTSLAKDMISEPKLFRRFGPDWTPILTSYCFLFPANFFHFRKVGGGGRVGVIGRWDNAGVHRMEYFRSYTLSYKTSFCKF